MLLQALTERKCGCGIIISGRVPHICGLCDAPIRHRTVYAWLAVCPASEDQVSFSNLKSGKYQENNCRVSNIITDEPSQTPSVPKHPASDIMN